MKRISVGFTGTQVGMNINQRIIVDAFLRRLKPTEVHHGDCIGADTDFHNICKALNTNIIIHPPIIETKRGFNYSEFIHHPKDYLVRNHDIVDASDWLFATPKENEEVLRSGTWATIRYAKKHLQKQRVIIIKPEKDKNNSFWEIF